MAKNSPSMWRVLYWELRYHRFPFVSWMVRNVPGEFGFILRRTVLSKYFAKVGSNTRIHGGVKIRNPGKLVIGDNVGIGEDVFIQAGGCVEIGNNVVLGPGVKIWSQNHQIRGLEPVNDIDYNFKKVIIGDDVWIGANAYIMPGTVLGLGNVVSACSVVGAKSYPPYAIISGFPARVIKLRKEGDGNVNEIEMAKT